MQTRQHALFQSYPLAGTVTLSTGAAPTPYHIYDGYGAFIAGTADLAAVRELIREESVQPTHSAAGRALLGIWVCDFSEASLGPHHELQFSIFVAPPEAAPISAHPLGLLAAMLTRRDLQMLCHGLWNNTPTVVAYNREALSLNAQLTRSHIEKDTRRLAFSFDSAATGAPILSGELSQPGRASLRAGFAFAGQLGFTRAQAIARQPWVSMRVVNPLGVKLERNTVAEACTHNDVNVLRYFEPGADSLRFGDTLYARLDFNPQVVQHMAGFKFVYLNPH
jgi:hypothetical protein